MFSFQNLHPRRQERARSRTRKGGRKLGFESIESRRLLSAAPMAVDLTQVGAPSFTVDLKLGPTLVNQTLVDGPSAARGGMIPLTDSGGLHVSGISFPVKPVDSFIVGLRPLLIGKDGPALAVGLVEAPEDADQNASATQGGVIALEIVAGGAPGVDEAATRGQPSPAPASESITTLRDSTTSDTPRRSVTDETGEWTREIVMESEVGSSVNLQTPDRVEARPAGLGRGGNGRWTPIDSSAISDEVTGMARLQSIESHVLHLDGDTNKASTADGDIAVGDNKAAHTATTFSPDDLYRASVPTALQFVAESLQQDDYDENVDMEQMFKDVASAYSGLIDNSVQSANTAIQALRVFELKDRAFEVSSVLLALSLEQVSRARRQRSFRAQSVRPPETNLLPRTANRKR